MSEQDFGNDFLLKCNASGHVTQGNIRSWLRSAFKCGLESIDCGIDAYAALKILGKSNAGGFGLIYGDGGETILDTPFLPIQLHLSLSMQDGEAKTNYSNPPAPPAQIHSAENLTVILP